MWHLPIPNSDKKMYKGLKKRKITENISIINVWTEHYQGRISIFSYFYEYLFFFFHLGIRLDIKVVRAKKTPETKGGRENSFHLTPCYSVGGRFAAIRFVGSVGAISRAIAQLFESDTRRARHAE